ncbi:MAG: UDP-N-acetylmuramoyl-tripeptide--D-alanyl-D-alanine ligase [Thermomicrobia bacterium]|nr:UDP-N-acetylmuramoyl-tripeptide--D-alanyl-D-alanine ligase [Thermomicrobia bacterium]
MIRLRDLLTGTNGTLGAGATMPADFLFRAIVIDSREVTKDALFFALPGATTDGHAFLGQVAERGAACAVVRADWLAAAIAAGNPPPLPVITVPETLTALQNLAAWWRSLYPVPLVGVTGSVGKTSTKELIATVLSRRFRVLRNPGNLNAITGMPLALLGLTPDVQVAVVEMGLYDPGDIATMVQIARPQIGVVTNVGVSHAERLGSQEALIANKGDLVAGLPPDGYAILNGDDPNVRGMRSRTAARVVTYGLNDDNDIRAAAVESEGLSGIAFRLMVPGERAVRVRLPLLGRHSVHTALAATGVARALGLALPDVLAGLEGEQTQLRLYTVPGPHGATLIDDTYNSSPQSTLAAFNLLAELDAPRRIAVLADMLELGVYEVEGHTRVGQRAAAVVDRLYTFGTRSAITAEAAMMAGMPRDAVVVFPPDQKEELAQQLRSELRPGDVVLIKGSRGMHMETLVDALRAETPAATSSASTERASTTTRPGGAA